jgi:hypothetical protein
LISFSIQSQTQINKMTELPPVQERFKTNLLDLGNLTHNLVINVQSQLTEKFDPLIVRVANTYNEKNAAVTLIEQFIIYSHQYWPEIKNSNEMFFANSFTNIFGQVPIDGLGGLKEMLVGRNASGAPIVSLDNKAAMWRYLQQMVRQAIMYLDEAMKTNKANAITLTSQNKMSSWTVTRDQLAKLIAEYKVKP